MDAFFYASASLAVVLATYLASSSGPPRLSRRLLSAAFLVIATLNILTLLQFDSLDHPVIVLRPGIAAALPVLLYLHIAVTSRPHQNLIYVDALHFIGPLCAIALRVQPNRGVLLDILIVFLSLFYLALIARDSRRGSRNIANLGAQFSLLFDRWRRLVMLFLIVVIMIDALIIYSAADDAGMSPPRWGFGLAGLLLVLGFSYLLVSGLHRKGPLAWVSGRFRPYAPERKRLIKRLESELLASGVFLDPNLTLQQFARRLGLQSREVSAAINDERDRNFNQWLNGFRVKEAKKMLRNEPNRSITEIMLASGFQTKSTFNAAFRASCGASPTEWRAKQLPP